MSIGIAQDHRDLAEAVADRAAALDGDTLVRAAEEKPDADFAAAWEALQEIGLPTIALAEEDGGGGGTLLDSAVAVEACSRGLVPGPALSSAVVAALLRDVPEAAALLTDGARVALGPTPELTPSGDGGAPTGTVRVVWDAPGASHYLLGARDGDGEQWFLVPAAQTSLTPAPGLDLSRRFGSVTVTDSADGVPVPGLTEQRVRRMLLTLAAAEASGTARWCLATAVEYARVREQFGQKIGQFQAVKHLCAQMLETAEAVTAVAWDAAAAADAADDNDGADGTAEQHAFAADVAGAVALEGAVRVAQDCIQVLGGIGFTFEHQAHLHLRRAMLLRTLLGSGDRYATALARRAAAGERRTVRLDLPGAEEVRREVRAEVAEIARATGEEQRRLLVDSGLLVPHWPAPYGRDADPVTQLVVDEELARAGVTRPDLAIGAWAMPTILAHGTAEQQERFVRPTLLGEVVWCQLFSEPGAGSDLASLRTRAERVEGGWELTGQKVWTSAAHTADWAICLARTDPEAERHRGISYFLVDMTAPGIEIRPLREMTGEAMFNEVFLDRVRVPDEQLVGEVDDGWRLARTTLANERVAMAGSKLGDSTERAVALLDDAEPTTTAQVGHQVALATVCLLLGVRTTLRSLAGQGPGPESSVAKLLGVRNRQEASALVVQMHGDRVLAPDEHVAADVHEALLTRCLSIAGGTTQVLRTVAAERVLRLPR